jgi:hypothetical protein
VLQAVKLTPLLPGAGPLTFVLTGYPGATLRARVLHGFPFAALKHVMKRLREQQIGWSARCSPSWLWIP